MFPEGPLSLSTRETSKRSQELRPHVFSLLATNLMCTSHTLCSISLCTSCVLYLRLLFSTSYNSPPSYPGSSVVSAVSPTSSISEGSITVEPPTVVTAPPVVRRITLRTGSPCTPVSLFGTLGRTTSCTTTPSTTVVMIDSFTTCFTDFGTFDGSMLNTTRVGRIDSITIPWPLVSSIISWTGDVNFRPTFTYVRSSMSSGSVTVIVISDTLRHVGIDMTNYPTTVTKD